MKSEQTILLPTGTLNVSVDVGYSSQELSGLCQFAARDNAKRGFLFVSKVLGKHLPTSAITMQETHRLLASKINVSPEDSSVLFIGMAETAVGLGYGVFHAWQDAHPQLQALFWQTSRYAINDYDIFGFEESHSHAPNQVLNLSADHSVYREDVSLLQLVRTLVLVDDEASTGNTFVNLSRVLAQMMPELQQIVILTLTDFMGESRRAEIQNQSSFPVKFISLLRGDWQFTPDSTFSAKKHPPNDIAVSGEKAVGGAFGRALLSQQLNVSDDLLFTVMTGLSEQQRLLIVGTGEFMAYPQLLAMKIAEISDLNVFVQSTTRSPILLGNAIEHIHQLGDHHGQGVQHYLYNVREADYDRIVILCETQPDCGLIDFAQSLNAHLWQVTEEHLR